MEFEGAFPFIILAATDQVSSRLDNSLSEG